MTHILPAALYGCEAVYVNKGALQDLRAAIANAIGPQGQRASTDLVFDSHLAARDIDPWVYILNARLAAIRRHLENNPQQKHVYSDHGLRENP